MSEFYTKHNYEPNEGLLNFASLPLLGDINTVIPFPSYPHLKVHQTILKVFHGLKQAPRQLQITVSCQHLSHTMLLIMHHFYVSLKLKL